MNLRTFHLLFILAAIILADMFGAWAVHETSVTGDGFYLWMGVPALIGGLVLCWYAYVLGRHPETFGHA